MSNLTEEDLFNILMSYNKGNTEILSQLLNVIDSSTLQFHLTHYMYI
jgi:hypothetical protein